MGGCISAREVAKMVKDAKVRVVVASPSLGLTMMGYLIEAAGRGVDVKVITRPTIVRGKALPTIKAFIEPSKWDWLTYFALFIVIMIVSYLMRFPSSLVLFMGLALVIGFMMYMFREFIALALKVKPRDFTVNVLKNKKTARAVVLGMLHNNHRRRPYHRVRLPGKLPAWHHTGYLAYSGLRHLLPIPILL